MELMTAIYERRAIRVFEERPVIESEVERLIDAAIQAPSAMDLEPWAFVVIEGKHRLEEYSGRAKERFLLHAPVNERIHAMLTDIGFNIFHGAPLLFVVCATSDDVQATEDCSLAAQNLMLAAHAMGLGSCPIGFSRPWLRLPETKKELGIPQEYIPAFPVVVGHPAEKPAAHRRRKPVVIHAP